MTALFSKPKAEVPVAIQEEDNDPSTVLQDESRKRTRARLNFSQGQDLLRSQSNATGQKNLLGA